MTKADIIEKIAVDTGLPKKDVAATVEAFMEEIRNAMAVKKENVYFPLKTCIVQIFYPFSHFRQLLISVKRQEFSSFKQ